MTHRLTDEQALKIAKLTRASFPGGADFMHVHGGADAVDVNAIKWEALTQCAEWLRRVGLPDAAVHVERYRDTAYPLAVSPPPSCTLSDGRVVTWQAGAALLRVTFPTGVTRECFRHARRTLAETGADFDALKKFVEARP